MNENEFSGRYRDAQEQARQWPIQPTGGGMAGAGYRHGVAKITDASDGDGTYTITQQQWDGAAWADGTTPACLVSADARDISERTTGAADDYVAFWEQRKTGGGVDILIDVGGTSTGLTSGYPVWRDVTQTGISLISGGAGIDYRGHYIWVDGMSLVDTPAGGDASAIWTQTPRSAPLLSWYVGPDYVAADAYWGNADVIGGINWDLYIDADGAGDAAGDLWFECTAYTARTQILLRFMIAEACDSSIAVAV